MARPIGPRLSVEPFIAALNANDIDPNFIEPALFARYRKGKSRGFFPLTVADELSCHVLKMHPFEVWGQEYEDKVWYDMHDEQEGGTDALPVPSEVVTIVFPARAVRTEAMAVAA